MKKFFIACLFIVLLFSPLSSFADNIKTFHTDIDGNGYPDEISVENGSVHVQFNSNDEYPPTGYVQQSFLHDFTGDNNQEVFLSFKEKGTGSALSYKVYSINGTVLEELFARSSLYKGIVDVSGNNIIETTPVYKDDDSNSSPSSFLQETYSYYNGSLTLTASITKDVSIKKSMSEPANVGQPVYKNPSKEEIDELFEQVAFEKGIPPVLLKAIAWQESKGYDYDNNVVINWRQFVNGDCLIGFDGVGLGIMQVSDYNANVPSQSEYIHRLEYDMEFNIREGAQILIDKWGYAFASSPLRPKIGIYNNNVFQSEPAVLENWYFAIWSYNGWLQRNNPSVAGVGNTYQDLVIKHAREQFNQLITQVPTGSLPLDITLSNSMTNHPEYQKFTTPEPAHQIQLKQYQSEDVIVCMTGSLSLRNDNMGLIKYINYGNCMVVLEGPLLYNGYHRYKVKLLDSSQSTGWVAMNWTKEIKSPDINGDAKISISDLALFALSFGSSIDNNDGRWNEKADLNYDLKINGYDFILFKMHYIE